MTRTIRTTLVRAVLTLALLASAFVAVPATTASAAALNVTAYGVSSAGADSTSALNSLLAGGGKSVFFPAGTYRFAGVSVPANSTLTFDAGAKILPGTNGGNFLNIAGANVTINGGSFDGQNTIAIAVMGSGVSGLTVDGTSATNMANGNVNLVNCTNATIRRTSTTNSQYGIVLSGSSYVTVDGTYAYGMGRDGILAYSSSHHITITNNYVERWATLLQDGRAGIHTYGSSDFVVSGNTVKNGLHNAEGIRFRDSERFECFNNVVDNTGGSGIAVVWLGDWQSVNGLVGGNGTIRHNTISNAKLRGISVPYTQLKPVRVLGNTITNTTSNFVPIDPADGIIVFAAGSSIVGNTVNGSTGNGIRVGGSNTLVSDNSISNVGTQAYGARSGVFVHGSNASVVRNTISGSATYGVYATTPVYTEANTISGAAYGATNLAGGTTGRYLGDATVPSVWSDISTSYSAGQSFNVSGSDANSGLAAIFVRVDGGPARPYAGSPVTLDVGLAGTHTISYWAVDMAGNSSAAQSRTYTVGSVITPTPDPVPTPDPQPLPVSVVAPTGLSGTAASSNGSSIVSLTWTDNATNESGYQVERAYENNGSLDAWVLIDTLPAGARTYEDRVALGSIYHYRVRAYATQNATTYTSAYSNAARVLSPGAVISTPVLTVPAAPANLTVSLYSRARARLTWTDVASNETGYEIWRLRDGTWSLYNTASANATTASTPRMTAGTYQFKVRAINAAGASAFCTPVSVTIR